MATAESVLTSPYWAISELFLVLAVLAWKNPFALLLTIAILLTTLVFSIILVARISGKKYRNHRLPIERKAEA